MRFPVRAAAVTAVALSICAAVGLAAPSAASESDATPSVPYTEHAAMSLTGDTLGLNDLRDPSPSDQSNAPAPVAIHAVAQIPDADDDDADSTRSQRSLADLVSDYSAADTPDAETDCLARAVYYESKGEPLAGQLTVADVILNRAHSGGRFPASVCGVVRQAGQFSFVHGGFIPTPPAGSRDWRVAVAIAQIAMQDLADGGAPRALFFHARSVRPAWRLTRVAAIGNHVFYR